ncbi:PIG-L family deacetylase [Flavobacterium sp.]|uniref:PIG-L family deacetylase n=1 Tax=Flavobacterium sp. TaxID=239 RepID=UPI0008D5293F|nr:PIG-L family deacetylase [Flavobacterium sp.]OGS62857.1 MAG: LmbE family protein [Flavobacteria bacterium GWF1_32_7]HBD26048.1 LmbE family protein [Flavobacterium sp.]
MKRSFTSIFIFFISILASAQAPQKLNSVEIYEQVQKLNFLGKVLYVAAHPDDENTKLITYFSNHYHAQTAYLSLTRGDGGQNLIGTELREKLGAIRTQELLAARRIDGGEQFFTRANDFGFSKEPNETFAIWNKNEVMEDVIQVIETFRPDIIVNRFSHNTPGTTHGHHTASAMLSLEAYDLVKYKPKRIFFNTSWWFYGSQEAFDAADKSKLLAINSNVFYPLKGKSNNEIAALSRSQHKCQGFGTLGSRGDETEYLELLKGDLPSNTNLFKGIDTSWNRVKGGNEIGKILYEIEKNFNFGNPSVHIPNLIKAYDLIQNLEDSHWKDIKSKQIIKIIEACSGLFMEAVADTETTTKDSNFNINIEVINRSQSNAKLISVKALQLPLETKNAVLKNNEKTSFQIKNVVIGETVDYSNLFWLKEKQTEGMYRVSDKSIRILPEISSNFPVIFTIEIEGKTIEFVKNICYKFNNPDDGETYVPFTVLPDVTTKIEPEVIIFNGTQAKEITVSVKAHKANAKGILSLNIPTDWKVNPKEIPFEITTKNEEKKFTFTLYPTKPEIATKLSAKAQIGNQTFDDKLITIQYPHIPKQTILVPSESKLVKLDIETKGKNIGYIMGAGDEVNKNLENLGFKVSTINPNEISTEKLQQFDAVILGIRAFNVVEELKYKNKTLFKYVENGGNLIIQYNTTNNLVTKEIAPYNLELSRDRVTDENAKVSFLAPNHKVLNQPNKITEKDFTGWVQEQGLYYPNKWSSEFIPILASNDEGESSKTGGLVIAKFGKGNYIYTGLSFFRELPEGVSGAYRLLANMIALDK